MKKYLLIGFSAFIIGSGISGIVGANIYDEQKAVNLKTQEKLKTTTIELINSEKNLETITNNNKANEITISKQKETIVELKSDNENALKEIEKLKQELKEEKSKK